MNYAKHQVLRIEAVVELIQLSRSHIYACVKDGTFPKPIKLGARAVGWVYTDIENWLDSRIEAANKKERQQ